MSRFIDRRTVFGAWFAVLIAIVGCEAIWGVSATIGTGPFLLAACLVPPAIVLMIWRRAPPQTVAEVFHGYRRARLTITNRRDA
jgi:hypothetical protein